MQANIPQDKNTANKGFLSMAEASRLANILGSEMAVNVGDKNKVLNGFVKDLVAVLATRDAKGGPKFFELADLKKAIAAA
jgi:hypothetical protein